MVEIIPFYEKYALGVELLISEIAKEFQKNISTSNSIDRIGSMDKFWLALDKGQLVGTIGIKLLENHNSILKNMFVHKTHRGSEKGFSKLLLETLLIWCNGHEISKIYLGTMSQFQRAHEFYEKNGFVVADYSELPRDFIRNPLDDVFYVKNLQKK